MTFPYPGSYYTFRLDPVASLRDIEDQAVLKAARELPTKVYVASTIDVRAPSLLRLGSSILCRILAPLSPRRHTAWRPYLLFSKVSHMISRRTSWSLECVFPFDRTRNTRTGADLLIAAILCPGMDAITSRERTCELGPRLDPSTRPILWALPNA